MTPSEDDAVQEQSAPHKRLLLRNATVLAVTAAAAVGVLVYPTSRSSSFASSTAQGSNGIVPRDSDLVVTGVAAPTEYGPVQVQLRIREGEIIVADAVVYPKGFGLDDIINNRAVPLLDKEVLAAQSAQIDSISAATYTSGGYIASLQSALDMAHLG